MLEDSFFKSENIKNLVIKSENQILQSYFIIHNYITEEEAITLLKKSESNWFVNYHIFAHFKGNAILEQEIEDYLVPNLVKNQKQKNTYLYFYKNNISEKNYIIRPINEVPLKIKAYLSEKKSERVKPNNISEV